MTMTAEIVQETIKLLTELIIEAFPGIQIVFCIGNHDFEPAHI